MLKAALPIGTTETDKIALAAELRDTKKEDAVAELFFYNIDVHSNKAYVESMPYADFTVELYLQIDTEGYSDTLTVTPSEGYYAVPNTVVVPEDESAIVYIYKYEGLSM